eukprot:scaffold37386_cov82-Phaeocystis_antarctica.AAC.4
MGWGRECSGIGGRIVRGAGVLGMVCGVWCVVCGVWSVVCGVCAEREASAAGREGCEGCAGYEGCEGVCEGMRGYVDGRERRLGGEVEQVEGVRVVGEWWAGGCGRADVGGADVGERMWASGCGRVGERMWVSGCGREWVWVSGCGWPGEVARVGVRDDARG